ncbi:hypothetical protein ACP70R_043780 [Stipagrostis hirtigluma subsp. patula]
MAEIGEAPAADLPIDAQYEGSGTTSRAFLLAHRRRHAARPLPLVFFRGLSTSCDPDAKARSEAVIHFRSDFALDPSAADLNNTAVSMDRALIVGGVFDVASKGRAEVVAVRGAPLVHGDRNLSPSVSFTPNAAGAVGIPSLLAGEIYDLAHKQGRAEDVAARGAPLVHGDGNLGSNAFFTHDARSSAPRFQTGGEHLGPYSDIFEEAHDEDAAVRARGLVLPGDDILLLGILSEVKLPVQLGNIGSPVPLAPLDCTSLLSMGTCTGW